MFGILIPILVNDTQQHFLLYEFGTLYLISLYVLSRVSYTSTHKSMPWKPITTLLFTERCIPYNVQPGNCPRAHKWLIKPFLFVSNKPKANFLTSFEIFLIIDRRSRGLKAYRKRSKSPIGRLPANEGAYLIAVFRVSEGPNYPLTSTAPNPICILGSQQLLP